MSYLLPVSEAPLPLYEVVVPLLLPGVGALLQSFVIPLVFFSRFSQDLSPKIFQYLVIKRTRVYTVK